MRTRDEQLAELVDSLERAVRELRQLERLEHVRPAEAGLMRRGVAELRRQLAELVGGGARPCGSSGSA